MLCRTRPSWECTTRTLRAGTQYRTSILQRRCLAIAVDNWDNYFEEVDSTQEAEARTPGKDSNISSGERNHGVFMGMVTSRAPQTTKLEELLAAIKPRPVGRPAEPVQAPSILTLLLTPAFAQHALDPQFPLQVLKRFGDAPMTKAIDTITAVVDRLPSPNNSASGEEGIGYCFDSQPSPLSLESQSPLQKTAQKPGSLTFNWKTLMKTTGTLQMHTRYEPDPTTGALREVISQRLESQAVDIPAPPNNAIEYRTPLIPLTPPRAIASSMGNIVRKLSTDLPFKFSQAKIAADDSSDNLVPASEELEKAVSDYFKVLEMGPEPVQVWAFIIADAPKGDFPSQNGGDILDLDNSVIRSIWESSRDSKAHAWDGFWGMANLAMLRRKCRLTKVLSGGGGWGKKAGLLSLDPDTKYSTRDLRGDQGWEFSFQDEYTDDMVAKHQRQALGEIVKPGEKIMFFLAPKESPPPSKEDIRSFNGSDRAFVFGAIPSSIDIVPGGAASTQDLAGMKIEHHRNIFGVLSEGLETITVPRTILISVERANHLRHRYATLKSRLVASAMGSPEMEMHWTLMQKRREALLSISWMDWDSKRCVAAWDRATETFLSELRVQLRRMIPEDSPVIATELDSTPKHKNSKQKTRTEKHHAQEIHSSGKNTSEKNKPKNDNPKNHNPKSDKPKKCTPNTNTSTPSKPKQSTAQQLDAKEASQPNKPVPIRTYMVDYAGMSISMATASASSSRSTKTTARPASSRQAEHIISSTPATDPNATSIIAKELHDPRCQPRDKCTSRDRTSEEKVTPTTTISASSTASSRKIIRRATTELNVQKDPEGPHSARPLRLPFIRKPKVPTPPLTFKRRKKVPAPRLRRRKAPTFSRRHLRKVAVRRPIARADLGPIVRQIDRPRSAEAENQRQIMRDEREQRQRRRAEIEQILLKEFDGAAKDLPAFPRLRRRTAAVGAWELADEVLDFVVKR
ncbi:uncharacterized protein MYCGRDRAFT_90032 [Zymoseptoria tritici IPO323]|uniref:Uncharacterized protein n=1 Tax=Zymoseptoria tritici (strain CBS 115943 / IPO323) TaxID=336722 RepID=F9X0M7_ZYMTI|nr:uncharacterized protein MYCGRDRAFT_90032 [Zymoseptoria tritici IPO323]EGP91652.1 hypothetical protein MYCGRDRAFT_90032 [Zymoseptoria tritici IPO323]